MTLLPVSAAFPRAELTAGGTGATGSGICLISRSALSLRIWVTCAGERTLSSLDSLKVDP